MPLRRDPMTGRLVHYPFADPPPDKVSSLTSVGGAPVGSPFVTIGNDATLTAERALAVTAGHLTLTDGGANSSVTLGLASVIAAAGPIGSATVVPIITYDAQGRLTTVTSTTISGVAPSAHNLLSAFHGDTVAQTVSRGSIIYGNSTPAWDELVIGATARVLRSNGTDISWAQVAAATDISGQLPLTNGGTGINAASVVDLFNQLDPLTARGDLLTRDATNSIRLPIGASARLLQSDGTDASWVALSSDATIAAGGALTLASVIVAGGPIGSTSVTPVITYDAKGRLTAVSSATITPAAIGAQPLDTDLTEIAAVANVRGDLLITNSGPTWVRLAIGAANRVLRSDGTDPSWAQVALATDVSGQLPLANGGTAINASSVTDLFNQLDPLTTRGDLLTRDATNSIRLAIGTADQVLKTNGTDAAWGKLVRANVTTPTGTTDTFVFATAPTFVTNITTPLIYGGAGTSDNLDLYANDEAIAQSNTGRIRLYERVKLHEGFAGGTAATTEAFLAFDKSFTAASQLTLIGLHLTPTITVNQLLGPAFYGILYAPTVNMTVAALVTNVVFQNSGTFRVSGTATVPGAVIAYDDVPVLNSTTSTATNSAVYRSFWSHPAVTTTGAASVLTYSEVNALVSELAMVPDNATGVATVTLRTGLYFKEATKTGAGTETLTTQVAVEIAALSAATTNLTLRSLGTSADMQHAGRVMIGATGAPDTTNGNVLELARVHTLTAGINDGQAAGLVLDPGYSGAFTVARHNYIKLEDESVAASAVVTDSCAFWFDAAIGTHGALASNGTVATTITSLGPTGAATTIQGWIKMNINGTIRYVPFW
jgi:hypothetical protein